MNLKDYKEKELNMYIIGVVFLYILITKSLIVNSDEIIYINQLITTTLSTGILYLFAYLSDAIVSSYFKDKIIYFFGMLKIPGENVFSNIQKKCKDNRIYKEKAMEKYNTIYKNMPKELEERKRYENSNWYSIYSKHRKEKIIEISNREYLMSRDFVFVTIAMLVIYIGIVILGLTIINIKFIVLLVILTIINLISANIKAKRFVYNVIAIDLAEQASN